MGKSPVSKRLVIWVDTQWRDHPKIKELDAQGHVVEALPVGPTLFPPPDLILSKAGHAWSDDLWPMLQVAIKRARARKAETMIADARDKVREGEA